MWICSECLAYDMKGRYMVSQPVLPVRNKYLLRTEGVEQLPDSSHCRFMMLIERMVRKIEEVN